MSFITQTIVYRRKLEEEKIYEVLATSPYKR